LFQAYFVVALIVLFCGGTVRADLTGSILGVVPDRSEGVIAGAKIVVTNAETNFWGRWTKVPAS
jgi:hypothetical protein